MSDDAHREILDVLVVGSGPTGIAVGARAREAGLSALLVDRGAVTANMLAFPRYMTFFTSRDRLEIPDVPFTSPDDKPDLRQALIYYRNVVEHYGIEVATHEEVLGATRRDDGIFAVAARDRGGRAVERRARNIVIATGYFGNPRRLGVSGEDADWVRSRYQEPYRHFGEHVVLVGGGNSACEAALELWRNGARVTMIVRGEGIKPTVKYWVKPDVENRIAEGAITARFETVVERFGDRVVRVVRGGEPTEIAADAAYVLIGYDTDSGLLGRCGVEVDEETLVPPFDPQTCESEVPGVYVAGAVQSGRDTNKIFIDNSREHAPRIVAHIVESGLGR